MAEAEGGRQAGKVRAHRLSVAAPAGVEMG